MIAFLFLRFLAAVFGFLVSVKRLLVFERHSAIMTDLAKFCCMHVSCMSVQLPEEPKYTVALIAFMFLFRVTLFAVTVCVKRSIVFKRIVEIMIFLVVFYCMNVSCMLFHIREKLKCLAALTALISFSFGTGNTRFRHTCYLDAEITDRAVLDTATTSHSII